MGKWTVTPGLSASGGGGPVSGTIGQFILDTGGGKTMSAVFAGVGASVGGPASFTYSDRNTTGYPGDLIIRGNADPNPMLLKLPTDGLMLCMGTAPRNLIPGVPVKPDAIAGFYSMIVVFGVTSTLTATTSIALDLAAKAKGWMVSGAYAYAVVGTLAKGVDAGGIDALAGSWFFT